MDLIDMIKFKPLISLHRFKRNLTPPDWRRRMREIKRHIRYECPKTCKQIKYSFVNKEFVQAVTRKYINNL
jgi:hypothetical protein